MNAKPIASRSRVHMGVAALVAVSIVGGAVLGTTRPWEQLTPTCPQVADQGTSSVARRWDDALFAANGGQLGVNCSHGRVVPSTAPPTMLTATSAATPM